MSEEQNENSEAQGRKTLMVLGATFIIPIIITLIGVYIVM
jgi:hypothetical protein